MKRLRTNGEQTAQSHLGNGEDGEACSAIKDGGRNCLVRRAASDRREAAHNVCRLRALPILHVFTQMFLGVNLFLGIAQIRIYCTYIAGYAIQYYPHILYWACRHKMPEYINHIRKMFHSSRCVHATGPVPDGYMHTASEVRMARQSHMRTYTMITTHHTSKSRNHRARPWHL